MSSSLSTRKLGAEQEPAKMASQLFQPSQVTPVASPAYQSSKRPADYENDAQNKRLKPCSLFHTTPRVSLEASVETEAVPATQPIDYTQLTQSDEHTSEELKKYLLFDAEKRTYPLLDNPVDSDVVVFSIGRDKHANINIAHRQVSALHATLYYNRVVDSWEVEAHKRCWLSTDDTAGNWQPLEANVRQSLRVGDTIRLLPPAKGLVPTQKTRAAELTLQRRITAGTASFEYKYLRTLSDVKARGRYQVNKKGASWTLDEPVMIAIDLRSDKDLLPLLTIRVIHPRSNMVEAIWYLRGEEAIHFLQANRCPYWDAQADQDGFVGLNYGLLTRFDSVNQLETKVIQPLCEGRSSRNMLCSLSKPGEETRQEACTSSVQFAVSGDEELNLTVNQRSSDLILGLPNDVVVWTIILHLVRREVKRRSGRELKAGHLYFSIAAGGAHVYEVNREDMQELLRRKPIPGVQPYLSALDWQGDIFSLAQNYSSKIGWRVTGYGPNDHHARMKIKQAS